MSIKMEIRVPLASPERSWIMLNRLLLITLLSAALVACGGGGSGAPSVLGSSSISGSSSSGVSSNSSSSSSSGGSSSSSGSASSSSGTSTSSSSGSSSSSSGSSSSSSSGSSSSGVSASSSGAATSGTTVYTNALSSAFLTVDLVNGNSLTYFGDKTPDGTPTNLLGVTTVANGAVSQQFEYDTSGELIWAAAPGGYSFQITWTAGVPSAVAVTTPTGQQVTGQLDWPAASTAAFAAVMLGRQGGHLMSVRRSTLRGTFVSQQSDDAPSLCETAETAGETVCTASQNVLKDAPAACTQFSGFFIGDFMWAQTAALEACLTILESAEASCSLLESSNVCRTINNSIDSMTNPAVSLTASANSVPPGGTILLSWSSTFVTQCTPTGGTGTDGWTTVQPDAAGVLDGDLQLTMPSDTAPGPYTYVMTCTEGTLPPVSSAVTITAVSNGTTTTVSSSPMSIPLDGGGVTLTAMISASSDLAGTPALTGTVIFLDQSGATLCSGVSLSNASASCSTSISMAPDTVTANYSGNANYAASTGHATITATSTCVPPAGATTCGVTVYTPDDVYAGQIVTPVNAVGTASNGAVLDFPQVVDLWQNVTAPCSVLNLASCLTIQAFSLCKVDGNFVPASANTSVPFTYPPTDASGCSGGGSGTETSSYSFTGGGILTMTDASQLSFAYTCSSAGGTSTTTDTDQNQTVIFVSLVDGSGSTSYSDNSSSSINSPPTSSESASATWSGATNPASLFQTMGITVQTTSVAAGQPLPQACLAP